MISLFRPHYGTQEAEAVARVLETGWSGLGPETEKFELEFSTHVGMKYGVATNSCTAALEISLKTIGVGNGDEVIVPSLTFVSSAHAILHCSAVPVFCDISKESLMIDWWDVKKRVTAKTKAIIAVNYAGAVPDEARSSFQGIPVVWDCAHAAGARIQYAQESTCCWSFHSVKNLSCGDGGMITTNNLFVKDKAIKLRWMGINKSTWRRIEHIGQPGAIGVENYSWEYDCSEIGIKGHMNDIAAAIGRVQLKKLDALQLQRRLIAKEYNEQLASVAEIELPKIQEGHGLHLFVIRTDYRNKLSAFLKKRGIQTGVHYKPIHSYGCYGPQKELPTVEKEWERLLSLPLHPLLTHTDTDSVVRGIKEFFKK